jgi:hypothetical protein
MNPAMLNPPVLSNSPIYFRASPNSLGIYDLPETDYEELHQLLLPYDSSISLEDAKKIGSFLLRIHVIVNTAKPKEADGVKKNQVKQLIKGVQDERNSN